MKIEKPGRYVATNGRIIVIDAVGEPAENGVRYAYGRYAGESIAEHSALYVWRAEDGSGAWAYPHGGIPSDIVNAWEEPKPALTIEPGAYRTRSGRKAIVDAIGAHCAYGWIDVGISTMGAFWAKGGGACHSPTWQKEDDLVAEWVDPPKPVKVWLWEVRPGGPYTASAGHDELAPGSADGCAGSAFITPGQWAEPADEPGVFEMGKVPVGTVYGGADVREGQKLYNAEMNRLHRRALDV